MSRAGTAALFFVSGRNRAGVNHAPCRRYADKGHKLRKHFQIDLVVDKQVIVELKAVDARHPAHQAQVMTYLRLTGLPAGLLINAPV